MSAMSASVSLAPWRINNSPKSEDSGDEFDLLDGGLPGIDKSPSLDKPSHSGFAMPSGRSAPANGCESVVEGKFGIACLSDDSASGSAVCETEIIGKVPQGKVPSKRGCPTRSGSPDAALAKKNKSGRKTEGCQNGLLDSTKRAAHSKCDAGTMGGGGEEEDRQRLPRRQHELSAGQINSRDVTASRGPASSSIGSSSACPDGEKPGTSRQGESCRDGSCSAGSYSRRRHDKLKEKRRAPGPAPEESVSYKLSPVFLWVHQEDTRIVQVMCEDYDRRNRLRLVKTHLGWRSLPYTERYATVTAPKPAPAVEEVAAEESRAKRGRRKKCEKRRRPKKVPTEPAGEAGETEDCKKVADECPAPEPGAEGQGQSATKSVTPPGTPVTRPDRPSSVDSVPEANITPARLTRSFSCEFPSVPNLARTLVRSVSLGQNMSDMNTVSVVSLGLVNNFKVQNGSGDDVPDAIAEEPPAVEPAPSTKEDAKAADPASEPDAGEVSQDDPEFTVKGCDSLGELVNSVPDVTFLEQEEDECVPKDLTVPKAMTEEMDRPRAKPSAFPAALSQVVTLTSTTKPPEPLTAPLPEVTITPVLTPAPAHQQRRQNHFLESLLSSPHPVKPERDEITVTRVAAKKKLPPADGPCHGKKLKGEDITLKSLLCKQQGEKLAKGLELEGHVRKIKNKQESESADLSKSRLQELLTEGVSSSTADPIAQLKQVLSNLSVPDPLLVPRARLPALVASPASEIPRLLSMHLQKKVEETPRPPMTDSDMLEVPLSNLRSLLSCSPDKTKATPPRDLASHQKSLETFHEWQRYRANLLEAQLKTSHLTQGLPTVDLAAATAFNQMMWLQYLDLKSSALPPTPSNPVFQPGYPTASSVPGIGSSYQQPSPFLPPTSPMDIDAHLRNFVMWQEAVLSQQGAHHSRRPQSSSMSSGQPDGKGLKIPQVPPSGQKRCRPNTTRPRSHHPAPSTSETQRNLFVFDNHLQVQQFRQQHEALLRQQYETQREHHKGPSELPRPLQNTTQADYHPARPTIIQQLAQSFDVDPEKGRGSAANRRVSGQLNKCGRRGRKQSWQLDRPSANEVAVQWQQFEEELRRSQPSTSRLNGDGSHVSLHQKGGVQEPPFRERKEKASEPAKLKVKNLVDPSMSPPKLLKQIVPEELAAVPNQQAPLQDESHELWHPLFGRKIVYPSRDPAPRATSSTATSESARDVRSTAVVPERNQPVQYLPPGPSSSVSREEVVGVQDMPLSSNQVQSSDQYNSPWTWTTVTVNGE